MLSDFEKVAKLKELLKNPMIEQGLTSAFMYYMNRDSGRGLKFVKHYEKIKKAVREL